MRKKVLYRVLLCTLWLLALTTTSNAQTKTLVGVINDQAGLPLEKATVKAKGEKASTVTDLNGRFHLTVPENVKALVISYAGITPQEISVEGKTTLAITINLAESKLNEVVVIGYGTAKRSDVSSAISSVKAKDLKDMPVTGIKPKGTRHVARTSLMSVARMVLLFIIGVFVYDEQMPGSRWIGFALVWLALCLMTYDSVAAVRRGRAAGADLDIEAAAQEAH
jgi:hypothetical protein